MRPATEGSAYVCMEWFCTLSGGRPFLEMSGQGGGKVTVGRRGLSFLTRPGERVAVSCGLSQRRSFLIPQSYFGPVAPAGRAQHMPLLCIFALCFQMGDGFMMTKCWLSSISSLLCTHSGDFYLEPTPCRARAPFLPLNLIVRLVIKACLHHQSEFTRHHSPDSPHAAWNRLGFGKCLLNE